MRYFMQGKASMTNNNERCDDMEYMGGKGLKAIFSKGTQQMHSQNF